ncbi:MAG: hypothetical protein HC763_27215 [Hydrococcus sp. CRU_1_1]|nr:hypothetical protein [Hydrococcus sp. CRU_1_1]
MSWRSRGIFYPFLEELAGQLPPQMTLSERQQVDFFELLNDLSVAIFECDRSNSLEAYQIRLQYYLESCVEQLLVNRDWNRRPKL